MALYQIQKHYTEVNVEKFGVLFAVNCRFKYRTSVGMVFASAMQHESALLVSSWWVLNANGLLRFHLPVKFKIRGMYYPKEGQSLELGSSPTFKLFLGFLH